jgi:CheY-like chemotaxis protein
MKSRAGSEVVERERVVIDRQVRHLGRLVDDLLDVSRITAGRIQLQLERIEVDAVVARAVEMTMPLIAERKHGLAVDVEAGLVVEGDPTRLAQVLANLLTNSARYTPPCGHIRLEASRDRESLRLRVSDDGVGIAPELLPHVFDVFTQGAQPLDRPHGGLGLGLAIVRSLVTLHRGTVTAHSDGRDRGARFEIRLPLAAGETIGEVAPANAGASENPRATARRARVLIVDDNRDGADLLADALELQGFATTIAHDGATALELAPRFAPDVALLDIGLPEMDGFEVARRLRTQAAPLKLIAITGYGQAEDRERSRSAGFDDFVVKPVDLARLRSILDRLLA